MSASGAAIAEGLAIRDGHIAALGSTEAMRTVRSRRVIDLRGRVVLPGLIDAHAHLASHSALAATIDARDLYDDTVRSVLDITGRIAERARHTPRGQWITIDASPLQDARLAERRLPSRAELDDASPDSPCYVAFGAHVTIANSLALAAGGIAEETPDPAGGVIERDRDGRLSGVLRERAQWAVRRRATDDSVSVLADKIESQLDRCAERGVTTIHDIVFEQKEIDAYELLADEDRLPVRVRLIVRVVESHLDSTAPADLRMDERSSKDLLGFAGIKLSIDGGITGGSAIFSDPLCGPRAGEGILRIVPQELEEILYEYHRSEINCCVHAMGDVALDMALAAFTSVMSRHPRHDLRHRIEHGGNWMIDGERLRRIRQLGLTLIPNPVFRWYLDRELAGLLGSRRARDAFPLATIMRSGIPVALGSDGPAYWPVDPLRDAAAAASGGWSLGADAEALTIEEAVGAITTGHLEPGMAADVIVVPYDPFVLDPKTLAALPVDLTVCAGRAMYAAEGGWA